MVESELDAFLNSRQDRIIPSLHLLRRNFDPSVRCSGALLCTSPLSVLRREKNGGHGGPAGRLGIPRCSSSAMGFIVAVCFTLSDDAQLTTAALNVFIRALFGDLRRCAGQFSGLRSSKCGAVTFVQRFGDALNSNLHFHSVAIDGVYSADDKGCPEFHALPRRKTMKLST